MFSEPFFLGRTTFIAWGGRPEPEEREGLSPLSHSEILGSPSVGVL